MIIGIVAIAENYAIGRDGKLPWHYSADLKFFKHTTVGNAVVMGSNTWRSIGKPLPSRLNIVISRSRTVEIPAGAVLLGSRDEVVGIADYLRCDTYIIGGAKTFAEFADVIDKWIVTHIPENVADADTFMPSDFLDGFQFNDSREIGDGLTVKSFLRR
ncbi:MAG TPA: dihydrofolate reductase [Pyrinomonadaceae bacterium]|nr:dihydrofolate reductase [Pyrinomonadaceae bacterium]